MTAQCLLEELRNIENKDAVICIGLKNHGLGIATGICVKGNNFIINSEDENDRITVRKLAGYLLRVNLKYTVKINFTGIHNIYIIDMYKSKYLILSSYL